MALWFVRFWCGLGEDIGIKKPLQRCRGDGKFLYISNRNLAELIFEWICLVVNFAEKSILVKPIVARSHTPFGLLEFLGDTADGALLTIEKDCMLREDFDSDCGVFFPMKNRTFADTHFKKIETWARCARLLGCIFIVFGQVILNFLCYFFSDIVVVEELEDSASLFDLDTEKLTVGIHSLRSEGRMQSLLNLSTVILIDFASKLAFERYWNTSGIEFFQPCVDVFACGHANFDEARHDRVGEEVNDTVFFHVRLLCCQL